MKSDFDKHAFWEEMKRIKGEYTIRVSKKPSGRAAKRITILISTAYLACNGSVHSIQDLESEIYRAVKEKHLDCDPLEMEAVERSYVCRDKKSKLSGRKIKETQFDSHRICTSEHPGQEIPKAALFADILTNYLTLEKEEQNAEKFSGDHPRARPGTTFRCEERHYVPHQEEGVAMRTTYKKPPSVPGQGCTDLDG